MKKKIGIISILFTLNNVICTLTNLNGFVLTWTSSGSKKLLGSKKLTSVGVYSAVTSLIKYVVKFNFTNLHLRLRGVSRFKKPIIRFLLSLNFTFNSIEDFTSLPHNGCRLKHFRRL